MKYLKAAGRRIKGREESWQVADEGRQERRKEAGLDEDEKRSVWAMLPDEIKKVNDQLWSMLEKRMYQELGGKIQ